MSSVLIDSDILIEVCRARDGAVVSRWRELMESDTVLLCSPVSIAELWRGVRSHEHKLVSGLFAALGCIPIDAQAGELAGGFMRDFGGSHGVELGDALIAATACLHKLQLWTRNRRHYPMREIAFY